MVLHGNLSATLIRSIVKYIKNINNIWNKTQLSAFRNSYGAIGMWSIKNWVIKNNNEQIIIIIIITGHDNDYELNRRGN